MAARTPEPTEKCQAKIFSPFDRSSFGKKHDAPQPSYIHIHAHYPPPAPPLKRRTFTFAQTGLALLGLAGIAYTAPLMAQANYPSRPVTIVVPHPAGGS